LRVQDGQIGPYRSAVQQYAAAGIPTFPLGGEDGKRPLVRRPMLFGVNASMKMADRYATANIGFWCGERSRLTVLDIDTNDERELRWGLDTFGQSPIVVRTGSGKFHVWYRHNGEPRRIRPFEGYSIDLLGSNGPCVAPPSVRPGANAYAFVSGSLEDIGRLPIIRPKAIQAFVRPAPGTAAEHEITSAVQTWAAEGVPKGNRNNALFGVGRQHAQECGSEAELRARLDIENCQRCFPPLASSEVERVAASLWRYKLEGKLWLGGGQKLVLDSSQISAFIHNGDADGLMLFVKAMQAHEGQRREFALSPKAMVRDRVLGSWSERRYRKAILANVTVGTLQRVHKGGSKKGDAAQYQMMDLHPHHRDRGAK
jgi:hypothetical protein